MTFLAWFALVALIEMATFFWVSSQIGLGYAIVIALATAFIGAYLVRRSGIAVWRRIRNRLRERQVPGRELVAGAAVLVAGALLISPGFITDILGFLLLVPAVQAAVYRIVAARFSSRIEVLGVSGAGFRDARDGSDWGWDTNDDVVDIEDID